METSESSIKRVKVNVPNAEDTIVFNKYDVASHLGNARCLCRRQRESAQAVRMKALSRAGDDNFGGSTYDWLIDPDNFTAKAWREFADADPPKDFSDAQPPLFEYAKSADAPASALFATGLAM